jgi:hypothetical protein
MLLLSFPSSHTDNLQVAKGPVFSLGDDDNSEIVDAMLRHMYNLPYLQPNIKEEGNLLNFHVDVYMLADKYDCPSLRNVAVINFRRTADRYLSSWGLRVTLDKCSLFKTIAEFCGPDAQQTADLSLRHEALKFCAFNYASFFTHKDFQKQVKDGTMFDADAMAELLMNVGSLALEKDIPSRPTRSRDYSGTFGWNCLRPEIELFNSADYQPY